ncbi:Hemerythrin-like domain-containing protein [Geosporobacter subterraneus DSM 17957]|uniref:Hemerythrin-like domain-containing protein n=1 Tax=Geosporobacter subterraneus DSM 17957 TaxID=1121919 RepID=A0A1M6DLS1_9FIRM|nr:hemerythrin domain-containing protein [Geosporobacter subterraneus]SHI74093.1 Hemerythrin-like domain-containing protein [Geosporobacter subterraneus DSM 17957]
MDAITLMIEEHKHIKRVLGITRKACIQILNGVPVNYEAFYKIIDFVRNYADKHHHSKEEDILFKRMSEELGDVVAHGPIMGMFAEHDLGRLFISNLETALQKSKDGDKDARVDIIANAIAYTDLLHRHIDKEDTAIYTFAQKKLSPKSLAEVEEKCRIIESLAHEKQLQDKYIRLIDELEKSVD